MRKIIFTSVLAAFFMAACSSVTDSSSDVLGFRGLKGVTVMEGGTPIKVIGVTEKFRADGGSTIIGPTTPRDADDWVEIGLDDASSVSRIIVSTQEKDVLVSTWALFQQDISVEKFETSGNRVKCVAVVIDSVSFDIKFNY